MSTERHNFEALLPFYLNGSATAPECDFIETYLRLHPEAKQSLAFGQIIQAAAQATAPKAMPDEQRVQRILDRWRAQRHQTLHLGVAKFGSQPHLTWHHWLSGSILTGLSAAATATVVFGISLSGEDFMHLDSLDGQADVVLTLQSGVKPNHASIVAALNAVNAAVVAQTQREGFHQISVDLPNRSTQQLALVEMLHKNGHLKQYTLLASD